MKEKSILKKKKKEKKKNIHNNNNNALEDIEKAKNDVEKFWGAYTNRIGI